MRLGRLHVTPLRGVATSNGGAHRALATEDPAIVNAASGVGSFDAVTKARPLRGAVGAAVYASSTAAVAMLTQYAQALPGIRINAVDPGPTATNFTNNQGEQTGCGPPTTIR